MKIILASASPRRRELLDQIGVCFAVQPACGEEKITSADPKKVVEELSAQKAAEVADTQKEGDWLVIGADTVVSCKGQILGKPGSEENAFRMLAMLEGNTHEVYTGVTLIRIKKESGHFYQESRTFSEGTDVSFYPMTEREICDYIATGEPMDKAGAYGIQGKAAIFVKGIRGDYNNVVGLPIARLYQELKSWKEKK